MIHTFSQAFAGLPPTFFSPTWRLEVQRRAGKGMEKKSSVSKMNLGCRIWCSMLIFDDSSAIQSWPFPPGKKELVFITLVLSFHSTGWMDLQAGSGSTMMFYKYIYIIYDFSFPNVLSYVGEERFKGGGVLPLGLWGNYKIYKGFSQWKVANLVIANSSLILPDLCPESPNTIIHHLNISYMIEPLSPFTFCPNKLE